MDTVLTLIALLTTTVVLILQNRQTKFERQRSHLELQVNLLTEQKVTAVIHLLEELRRHLPIVANATMGRRRSCRKGPMRRKYSPRCTKAE